MMHLAATNQSLRGHFAAQTVPIPETGSWMAGETASGGKFSGDYESAGIRLIGFSFMAQDVLPSAAAVRWHGASSGFFRSFASYVAATGVWYRFAFSLADKDAGKWVGGSPLAFEETLRMVERLEIQLTRAGMGAQRYYVDDVFVDGLPVGALGSTGGIHVLWSALRVNTPYLIQSADRPSDTWNARSNFVATNATRFWPDPTATNGSRVYRLVFGECR